jgi:carbamoyl-phosphate synthase large subunit
MKKDRSTVHGVTRDAPKVVESCYRIGEQLKPSGPINVQQMCDENGDPYVIEINPRFSSSACLTVSAGVDELAILIRDAVGLPYEEPDGYESELHMLRYTDQIFVENEKIFSGGSIETDEL